MGLYDRDYYRDAGPRRGLLDGMAPACKILIAANVVVYLLQMLTLQSRHGGVTGWFDLSATEILQRGQVWRLLTSSFCHNPHDVWHLIFNMLGLWMFGSMVEAIYGSKEFLRFYLMAAVLSAAGYLGVELAIKQFAAHQIPPELGASGAVMAVMMLCATYYPRMKILVMFVIPLELRWLIGLFIVYDLFPLLKELGGGQTMDNVAHATHLTGLLYGFLYRKFDWRFDRLLAGFQGAGVKRAVKATLASRPSQVKIYEPPAESMPAADFNRRVDEILAKISTEGESSLTDAERDLLKEASRRYKKR